MDIGSILRVADMLRSPRYQVANNIRIECPFATTRHQRRADGKQSMAVEIRDDQGSRVICFSCGTQGSLKRIMREAYAEGTIPQDVLQFVEDTDKGGIEGAMARLRATHEKAPEPHEKFRLDLQRYIARCKRFVPHYAVDRGLLRADIERWEVGFDEQYHRMVLPIRDETGKLVGATRRTVHRETFPVYLDTPGLPKTEIFYGENFIDRTIGRGYLVEGPLDVVFASRTLRNVIGSLGAKTGLSRGEYAPVRLAKLKAWFRELVILYDGDPAGREAVFGWWSTRGEWTPGLRDVLRPHLAVRVGFFPEGDDAASVPPQTLTETASSARYFIPFVRPPKPGRQNLTRRPGLFSIGGRQVGNQASPSSTHDV